MLLLLSALTHGRFLSQSDGRLQKKISEVVTMIGKKSVPAWKTHLLLEVMVCDEDGEDVDVPFVVVRL